MANNNQPTKAWKPPNWGSYTGSPLANALRQTFDSLSDFLAHPYFQNGVTIGDGTPDTKDPDTGVVHPAPTVEVTIPTVTLPPQEVLDRLDELDDIAEGLANDPIEFTRITDVLIETPMLAANSVGADALAAVNLSVGKFIRSRTYTPGVAGWAIDASGTAEFNNVTVRGNIQTGIGANRVEINTSPGFRIAWFRNGTQVASADGVVGGLQVFATDAAFSGNVRASGDLHGTSGFYASQVEVGGNAAFGYVRLGPGARVYSGGVARVQTQDTVGNLCNIRVASVEYTGGLVFISDRNLKRNISIKESNALSDILDTPIYTWEYDPEKVEVNDLSENQEHLGPMLDEAPDAIKSGNRIDLNAWVATLHQAVQELTEEVRGSGR